MIDVLCIGAVSRDEHVFVPEAHLHCHSGEKVCDLSLPFGVKLSSKPFVETVGGNAANVAVGLRRQGFKVELLSWVGKDLCGDGILKVLRTEKVRVRAERVKFSNKSVILHSGAERTILSGHADHSYKLPSDVNWKVKVVYITSMSKGSEHILLKVLKLPKTSLLVFNPGRYQLNLGTKSNSVLFSVLRRVNILILNKEEAQQLTQSIRVEELLLSLLTMGPKIVIITDGVRGAWVSDGVIIYHASCARAKAVDATGAGDAFASGFLGIHLRGGTLQESLIGGAENSASVVSIVGAQNGLLGASEISKKVIFSTVRVQQIH